MPSFSTHQARTYGPTVADLIELAGTLEDLTEAQRAEWQTLTTLDDVTVGDVVYALSRGAYRRGVVTLVGRSRLRVAYTTEAAYKESQRHGEDTISVTETPRTADQVMVRAAQPAAPEAPAELDLDAPTDPTVGDMTYVARREAPTERGLVVGYPPSRSWVMVAWGKASGLTTQYAMAEAVREDPANLVPWEAPNLERGRCRHDGRPIVRHTDQGPEAQWWHADARGGRRCIGMQTWAEPIIAEATPSPEVLASVVDALKPKPGEPIAVSLARVTGWAAYRAGEPRIPIENPVIRKAIEPLRVGQGAAAIFRAFLAGWDLAADEAAQAVLAAPAPARPTPGPLGALHAFHDEQHGRASAEGLCSAQGARVPDALVTCPQCAALLADGRPAPEAQPAEHAHTLGMRCPVAECTWPLESGPRGVDYAPEAARQLAWGAMGMGHALPPAADPGQL